MDINEAVFKRRSVRRYSEERVPDDIIKQIIEAGTWAPSACNFQAWKFVVIDDAALIDKLCSHGAAAFLKNAHQMILVLYNNNTDNMMYHDHIQSASACIQNMLLMAYSLGVGTCWVNFLPPKSVMRKLFNIPSFYDPVAMVSIGYNSKLTNGCKRKHSIDELICKNKYYFPGDVTCKKSVKVRVKRILRKIYFIFPFKKVITKILDKYEKKFEN